MTLKELGLLPPDVSEDELLQARSSNDYIPLIFKRYRFVGNLAMAVVQLQPLQFLLEGPRRKQYHVICGLLNRAGRLIFSNVALVHEGRFGEAMAIIDRSIFETAVKLIWLCSEPSREKFQIFYANSLLPEIELKAIIERNIQARGTSLPIEERMLNSINRHFDAAGLRETEINGTPKMPSIAAMLTAIGRDRLDYVVAQRIGSHHVHGTWPSLLLHYLRPDKSSPEGELNFLPNGAFCEPNVNQFFYGSLLTLECIEHYASICFGECNLSDEVFALTRSARDAIILVLNELHEQDR